MKATFGGYRHLVRNTGHFSDRSSTRLKEILIKDFPEAYNAPHATPEELSATLAQSLLALAQLADRQFGKNPKASLWSVRIDKPLHENPGQTQAIWKLLNTKLPLETLDTPTSLIRVIDAITHLGSCQGLTLSDIAEQSLDSVNS